MLAYGKEKAEDDYNSISELFARKAAQNEIQRLREYREMQTAQRKKMGYAHA